MSFNNIVHLMCPKCKGRNFAIFQRRCYTGPIPIEGNLGPPVNAATCFSCGSTTDLDDLWMAGEYDSAEKFAEALSNYGKG